MRKNKKRIISIEVFKYPYCGKFESDELLSEKICSYTITLRKKIFGKTRKVFICGQLLFSIISGVCPSHAIGLPKPMTRYVHLNNNNLLKDTLIFQALEEISTGTDFTKSEIDQLYHLSIEYKNNCLSREELVNRISNLRGGGFIDIVSALAVVAGVIVLLLNEQGLGFQQANQHVIIPLYL